MGGYMCLFGICHSRCSESIFHEGGRGVDKTNARTVDIGVEYIVLWVADLNIDISPCKLYLNALGIVLRERW